ncbi:MAG TPA: hypothetical protein PLL30_16950 [Candidatus Krumholzibacteria bacterium]|jgi:predicted membrane-bound dolichyl-phosphate-mannose-protein mannosyltransferase|nr:hypothetical protein [Candidatus Krumholzibacteria bacterium]HPD73463.1 hypothetical protein [Candidatus Krumholzibacteria bacterium]HRY42186.1 hypothetical protein [Candidatus Krumholzibacteria bacterium]
MIKHIHLFNCILWLGNASLWTFYAKVPFMGVACAAVAILSYKLAQWEHNQ